MIKVQSVFVRNNSGELFLDRFNGEDFTIPPGRALEIEVDAAKLVFGFGEDDKSRAIKRLGWAPASNEMPRAIARLGAFSFHMDQSEAEKNRSSAPAVNRNAAGESPDKPAAERPTRRRKYKRRSKRAKRAAPAAPAGHTTESAQPPHVSAAG